MSVGPFPGGFGFPLIVFCLLLGISFLGGFCNVWGCILAGTGFRQSIFETTSFRFSNVRPDRAKVIPSVGFLTVELGVVNRWTPLGVPTPFACTRYFFSTAALTGKSSNASNSVPSPKSRIRRGVVKTFVRRASFLRLSGANMGVRLPLVEVDRMVDTEPCL